MGDGELTMNEPWPRTRAGTQDEPPFHSIAMRAPESTFRA